MNKPLVIGHRGSPNLSPENTLTSFETAIKQGADMIELDLQESSDGHLIIFHDYDVERISGQSGMIAEMTLDEIKAIDLEGGNKIPTLNEVLQNLRGRIKINIELKVQDIESKTLAVVKENEMMHDVLFSSFFHGILTDIKDLDSNAEIGLLYNSPFEDLIEYALDMKASSINPLFFLLEPDIVENAHEVGLKVYPWTVNDEDMIEELIRMNVDGIITDVPDLCRTIIDRIDT